MYFVINCTLNIGLYLGYLGLYSLYILQNRHFAARICTVDIIQQILQSNTRNNLQNDIMWSEKCLKNVIKS